MADAQLTELSADGGYATGNDQDSASVQVPDSQYYEASSSHFVPTKTGDEEAVGETQFDEERPRTAGTTHSSTTDFDNTDDGAFLATVTVAEASRDGGITGSTNSSRDINSWLAMPALASELGPDTEFSFTKASHKQLDFNGKRKGPVASGATADQETVHQHPETSAESHQGSLMAAEPGPGDNQDSVTQPAVDVKERKRKKKKRRRYDTAPTEPTEQYTLAEPAEQAAAYPSVEVPDDANNDHLINVVDAYEPVPEYQEERRPVTPEDQGGDVLLEAGASSPHTQLQNDLQAAAFEQVRDADNINGEQAFQDAEPMDQEVPGLEAPTSAHTLERLPQPGHDGRPAGFRQESRQRRASSRPDSGRVTKRKSKAGRRATAPAPAETLHSDQSTSDVNDYMQILAYKVQQKQQSSSSRLAAERQAMEAELQQILEAKQALQEELEAARQQRGNLTTIVEQQKTKVAAYEAKMSRFKTFVDGLGNDVDALKKEAGTTRRKGEQLAREGEDRKAEQTALFEQLSTCAEKSAQLKDQALRACQDAQVELQAAHLQNNYLEQQLSERVGLLAEERDRRSQLERQLATAASSDETVLRALKSNNDAVMDKLFEIHAVIEDAEDGKRITEMMDKALAAVQALTSQDSANADDLASVKGMVESMSERQVLIPTLHIAPANQAYSVNGFFEAANSTRDGERSDVTAIQAHLDDALKGLRADLSEREDLIRQDATHREAIHGLQDKLKACNIRATEATSQLSATQARENHLKEQNGSLHARITALQSKCSPSENAHVQLSEVKEELNRKTQALETARTELNGKTEELRTLSATNLNLQDQVRSLQRRLEEIQSQVIDFGPERAKLETKFKAQLERIQTEMADHSRHAYIKDKMDNDNKLLQMTSSKDTLQKQVKPLKDELAATKAKLAELQSQSSKVTDDMGLKLHQKEAHLQAKQQEIETLQESLKELEGHLKGYASAKSQYDALSTQHHALHTELSAEQSKYQDILKQKSAVAKKAEDTQHALEKAQSAEEEAKAELERHRAETATALEDLENQLADAKEAADRAEVGFEHYKQSCEDATSKAEEQSRERLEALQETFSQKEKELKEQEVDSEAFRKQIDEAWRDAQDKIKNATNKAKAEVAEAQTRRDEAIAENERLRKELADLANKQAEALQLQLEQLKQHQIQQRPSSRASTVSASRLRVPLLRKGITPTASNKENEPPKPRKKVDRNANVIIGTGPVPVPEVLRRPESRTKDSAKDSTNARGPVVEESQLQEATPAPYAGIGTDLRKELHKPSLFGMFSDSDDMLDTASMRSKQLLQTVEETQFDDKLPSFAAFNNSMASSHAARSKPPSSVFSVPSLRGTASQPPTMHHSTTSEELRKDHDRQAAQSAFNEFVIYEDSQPLHHSSSSLHVDARRHVQDSSSLSQAEIEKYTFRKTYPHPNSASKMVHRAEQGDQGAKRRRSDISDAATSRGAAVHTPNIRGEGRDSASRGMHPPTATHTHVMHSSSPDFIHDAASARKTNTYHTPGGSGSAKRRLSRTNSGTPADPRLARREAPVTSKRKAEGFIVEGYEHERKKRLTKGPAAAPTKASRYSLRASTYQPSINDLPSMPSTSARGSSSSQLSRAGPNSRMRTLAGSSTRATHGLKKLSKTDEMNSRFAQELSR
ncbi:hypothetical protein LTR85_001064 [Meristemomyces frigidus]|nr:hypothetical protein LTR85_001064 [Meristemomyces frigidus]